jgi:hypothetical protein
MWCPVVCGKGMVGLSRGGHGYKFKRPDPSLNFAEEVISDRSSAVFCGLIIITNKGIMNWHLINTAGRGVRQINWGGRWWILEDVGHSRRTGGRMRAPHPPDCPRGLSRRSKPDR